MQFFKNDALENKINDSVETLFDNIGTEIDTMESECFECYKLGEVLYDNDLMPLTNAIQRQVFVKCFPQVFEAWSKCGTFESYIAVFKKVFGSDAEITFTIPGAGQLDIAIVSTQTDLYFFVARELSGATWVNHYIVDESSDHILFNTQSGIESQYELEKVLFSMAPNGIFTQISLTISFA